ncbi:hypothetical protein BBU72A_S0011 (plasmid) [Borreliella burgdorferi 72a]|nr:hypothetical protein BBU72A_S0011 [Borreliella burgdorferi 72a]
MFFLTKEFIYTQGKRVGNSGFKKFVKAQGDNITVLYEKIC